MIRISTAKLTKKQISGNVMLLICSIIWGTTFVFQRQAMQYVEPFTFVCLRSVLACIVLIPIAFIVDRANKQTQGKITFLGANYTDKKALLLGGSLAGLCLAVATCLQQIGLTEVSAGKAGFLTALYIIIVPIASFFFGKRPGITVWLAVALSFAGVYLLCVKEGFTFAPSDLLIIVSAFIYSAQILLIERFAPRADSIRFSIVQFIVCTLVSGVMMLATETPTWKGISSSVISILYAGVLSSGVAFTLQIMGQKNVNATVASLIMCLESVFALISGWIILDELLSVREIIGCGLMFLATLCANIPISLSQKKEEKEAENQEEEKDRTD